MKINNKMQTSSCTPPTTFFLSTQSVYVLPVPIPSTDTQTVFLSSSLILQVSLGRCSFSSSSITPRQIALQLTLRLLLQTGRVNNHHSLATAAPLQIHRLLLLLTLSCLIAGHQHHCGRRDGGRGWFPFHRVRSLLYHRLLIRLHHHHRRIGRGRRN